MYVCVYVWMRLYHCVCKSCMCVSVVCVCVSKVRLCASNNNNNINKNLLVDPKDIMNTKVSKLMLQCQIN